MFYLRNHFIFIFVKFESVPSSSNYKPYCILVSCIVSNRKCSISGHRIPRIRNDFFESQVFDYFTKKVLKIENRMLYDPVTFRWHRYKFIELNSQKNFFFNHFLDVYTELQIYVSYVQYSSSTYYVLKRLQKKNRESSKSALAPFLHFKGH